MSTLRQKLEEEFLRSNENLDEKIKRLSLGDEELEKESQEKHKYLTYEEDDKVSNDH